MTESVTRRASRALLAPSRPPLNISPGGDRQEPFLMLRGPGEKAVGGGKRHPNTKVNFVHPFRLLRDHEGVADYHSRVRRARFRHGRCREPAQAGGS